MNLIIDIGNSTCKLAVFHQGEMIEVLRCSHHFQTELTMLCDKHPIRQGIISSVISLNDEIHSLIHSCPFPILEFNYKTPIPIKNLYQTPETLGMDRLAAVIAAQHIHPNRQILIIDAGTCITYDIIDELGQYHGGNISPGMEMRLKSLHTFTDKLPKVQANGEIPQYGYSTETAIRAGVIRGIEYEMSGYIRQLQKNYPELLVFLTGGNEFSFETNLKNTIFADGFLVLKGLNRILEHNETL